MHRSYRRFQTVWADILLISENRHVQLNIPIFSIQQSSLISDFEQDSVAVDRLLDWFKSVVDDFSSRRTGSASTVTQTAVFDQSTGQSESVLSSKEFSRTLLRIVQKFDKYVCCLITIFNAKSVKTKRSQPR
jgi:hypothetical protein